VLLTEPGPWSLAISLGVFRERARAEARLDELRRKGVRTAVYRQREQTLALTSLVIKEPSQELLGRLNAVAGQLPGTVLTTGACPEVR